MSDEEEIAALRRRLDELEAKRSPPPQPPPSTAADRNPGPKRSLWPAAALLASLLGAIIALDRCGSPTSETGVPVAVSTSDDPDVNAGAAAIARAAAIQTWRYSDEVDPMTDKRTRTACITSDDKVILDSPYKPVTAQLCVRNSAKFGVDAYFSLEGRGQILCDSYSGCTGHIRINDGPRTAIRMVEPADHSTETLFFASGRRTATLLEKATRTRVELTYYQAGNQAVTFNTVGLNLHQLGIAPSPK